MKAESKLGLSSLSKPVGLPSRKNLFRLGIVLVLVAGLFGLWRWLSNPSPPWLVRWKLEHYLKKQAHTGNFKTDFQFPSKTDMARKAPKPAENPRISKGTLTGKDFETLRTEYAS